MNPFEYVHTPPGFDLRQGKSNGHWKHYSVKFPVVFPGTFLDSDLAFGEYYHPLEPGKHPLVILTHGWGDRSIIPVHMLARHLVKKGMAAFLLYLPFHSRRLPDEMWRRRYDLNDADWLAGYRLGVTDIQRIVDWAASNSDIDSSRVAVVALSLGAFIGSISMALDERIRIGVFIVAGANSAKIARFSFAGGLKKSHRFTEAQYREYLDVFTPYLDSVSRKGWKNVEPDKTTFLLDPLTYAEGLRRKNLMMINARWDEFIPRAATIDLWKACGECPITWLPTTHASIWLWYPLIAGRIHRFLADSFNGKSSAVLPLS